MRQSQLLGRTLRDDPNDAEVASHRLLVRAGYTRRLASGIWSYLPLGRRVLDRIASVVREEMDRAGAQELLMPVLQPIDRWVASGRAEKLDTDFHAFRVEGRGGEFVLGPTHEEIVTELVGGEVASPSDLPVTVYQVQTKFRDEARPRYGLLRGREFVMKDAYSFDLDAEGLQRSYDAVFAAYLRIFERLELDVTPVEASSGAFGGAVNHEFMVPTAIGEDVYARCTSCGYAANLEVAEHGLSYVQTDIGRPPMEEHHTPDCPGIDAVVEFFAEQGLTAAGMLKCIAFVDDHDQPVVVVVPGDRDVRPKPGWRPFDDADFVRHPELVKGYIGPVGLRERGIRVVADPVVLNLMPGVTGANKPDHHVMHCTYRRDWEADEFGSFATVKTGDSCPRCQVDTSGPRQMVDPARRPSTLELVRSVEAAHTFQLGNRYTDRFWMGCYGVGVSRLVAVIAEEHHDDAGLRWPAAVAPFDVHLLALGADRSPEVAAAADRLYESLTAEGRAVLYDDRPVSPGVKFADADLIGIPEHLVVGTKGLARGVLEVKDRRTGERSERPL